MSGRAKRFRYRYPLWVGLGALLIAGYFLFVSVAGGAFHRVFSALIGVGAAVFAFGALRSYVARFDVVLTDHAITITGPLRKPVRIDFGATERLEVRTAGPHRELHVSAPGQHITVSDMALRDNETFDRITETVAERVAAHGGPALIVVPRSRFDGSFVA